MLIRTSFLKPGIDKTNVNPPMFTHYNIVPVYGTEDTGSGDVDATPPLSVLDPFVLELFSLLSDGLLFTVLPSVVLSLELSMTGSSIMVSPAPSSVTL